MNKPLTCSKALDLVNIMIKDTPTTKAIKEFKEGYHLLADRDVADDEKVSLSYRYSAAFLS